MKTYFVTDDQPVELVGRDAMMARDSEAWRGEAVSEAPEPELVGREAMMARDAEMWRGGDHGK